MSPLHLDDLHDRQQTEVRSMALARGAKA